MDIASWLDIHISVSPSTASMARASSKYFSRRAISATSAPACDSATAMSRPRPRERPVTSATLPLSLNRSKTFMEMSWAKPLF